MAYTARLAWEPLRSIDSATMVSAVTYYPLGTQLQNPSYILKLVNNSSVLVKISVDGLTDVDVAPATSQWLYNEQKPGVPVMPALPAGTQFYVKSAAAGTGLIYLVSQYIVANNTL